MSRDLLAEQDRTAEDADAAIRAQLAELVARAKARKGQPRRVVKRC